MVPADIRCVAAAALRVRVLAPVQRAGRCFGWLSTCASCAAPAAGLTEMKHFAGSKAAVHPGCDRAGKYNSRTLLLRHAAVSMYERAVGWMSE